MGSLYFECRENRPGPGPEHWSKIAFLNPDVLINSLQTALRSNNNANSDQHERQASEATAEPADAVA